MSNKAMRFGGFIAGIATAALVAMPGLAMAQHSGGGGGGGGHFSGGGHMGGGIGGGAHFGGFGGGAHYAPRSSYAPRYSYAPRSSYAPRYSSSAGYSYSRGYTARGYAGAPGGSAHSYGGVTGGARVAASSAWGAHGHAYAGVPGHGWYGPHYGYHPYWGGGYWYGSWWPRAYYGWAFPWFFPVLPLGYATFWWSGIPYYYVNSVYYTWNADDNGYVVTNPPPAGGDVAADQPQDESNAPAGESGSAPVASAPDDVYMYPQNGQSQEQQSTDRYQCHKWAQDQTGFDPTQPNGGSASASPDDYRRAMIACLDARGYSTQ